MPLNLNFTGVSGQTNYVCLVQRMSDLAFASGATGPFLAGLTFNQKKIVMTEGLLGNYQVTLDNSAWVDSEYHMYVCDSGTQLTYGSTNFWTEHGIESVPSGIAYTIWDEPISLHNTNGTFGSGENKNYQDLYFANIKAVIADNTQQDYVGATWYKNNLVLNSGSLTNPAVSIYRTDTGAALISNAVMSYTSPQLSSVYYNTAVPNLFPSGIPILINISGVIDGASRVWNSIVGVDIL